MPALPLDDAGPYVAAAYAVFVGLVLLYVTIMAGKLARMERELRELGELLARREEDAGVEDAREPVASGSGPR